MLYFLEIMLTWIVLSITVLGTVYGFCKLKWLNGEGTIKPSMLLYTAVGLLVVSVYFKENIKIFIWNKTVEMQEGTKEMENVE